MDKQPFDGLKVLDFSRVIAGPLATEYLAQYGAFVLRIESSTSPDTLRISAPYPDFKMGLNRSGYFAAYNANKYSMSINLKHPKAEEIISRLVEWCDVVVENFSPGAMKKLGFDYPRLKEIKPDIIMLSTSNQGQTGPQAKTPGYGFTLCALCGITNMTGWPDREPCHPFGALTDFITPIISLTVLIGALEHRRRTGKGQHLDVSQYETSLFFLTPALLDYEVNGHERGRMGNRSDFAAPHGAYPCRGHNSWCVMSVEDEFEWKAFCETTEMPYLLDHPDFQTFEKRKENEDKLDGIVAKWTKEKDAKDVMTRLQDAGISAGVVQNIAELFTDQQLSQRDHYRCLEHPEIGQQSYERLPFRLSNCPAQLRRAAPCLGEHTEYVCSELLGMSDEEFVDLLADGAFS